MQYKDILLYIDDGKSNAVRMSAGFALAKEHDATVTGVTLATMKPANTKTKNADKLKNICDQAAQNRLDDFMSAAKAAGVSARTHIIYVSHVLGEQPQCINQRLVFEDSGRGYHRLIEH